MTDKETRVDKLVKKGKNNPIIAFVIVFVLVIVGLSTLTDAVDKLMVFANRYFLAKKDTIQIPTTSPDVPNRQVTQTKLKDTSNKVVSKPLQAPSNVQEQTPNKLASAIDRDGTTDTDPKKLTDELNEATISGVAPEKPKHIASGCANEEMLKHGLVAAGQIVSSTERDDAHRKIVEKALCSSRYDIATESAGKIISSTSRDAAHMEIIRST